MSIATEITRLQNAKSALATSIGNKGVTVPSATKLDGYAALVDSIQTGGGGEEEPDFSLLRQANGSSVDAYFLYDCKQAIDEQIDIPVYFSYRQQFFYMQRGKVSNGIFTADGSGTITLPHTTTWDVYSVNLPRDCGRYVVYRIWYEGTSTAATVGITNGPVGRDTYSQPILAVKRFGGSSYQPSTGNPFTKYWYVPASPENSFTGMSSLQSIDFSILNIRASISNLFKGCHLLTDIDFSKFNNRTTTVSNISSLCEGCSSLRKADLTPLNLSGVTTNANARNVFSTCYFLEEIKIPASLTYIGQNFAIYCASCLAYVFEGTTPPTLYDSSVFTINTGTKIYVPDESVNAYKTATNWATYADYITKISDYTG